MNPRPRVVGVPKDLLGAPVPCEEPTDVAAKLSTFIGLIPATGREHLYVIPLLEWRSLVMIGNL
jgi:hypothetical protein